MVLIIMCFVKFLIKRVLFKTHKIKYERKITWDKTQKRNVKTICSMIQLLIIKLITNNVPKIANN